MSQPGFDWVNWRSHVRGFMLNSASRFDQCLRSDIINDVVDWHLKVQSFAADIDMNLWNINTWLHKDH